MDIVNIDLGDRAYQILIDWNIDFNQHLEGESSKSRMAVVVTNVTIGGLHLNRVVGLLARIFENVRVIELPDGEKYKSWDSLNIIFSSLLNWRCDRKTTLFALGGGVVGDLTGFAAATYMRGIPFVQLPTTLLAQVDSSVGGKTAINHPLGKNMIGAFYQPQMVICDLSTLSTLPDRELRAGLAEVIKYGSIADLAFMHWLEQNLNAVMAKEVPALAHVVRQSCEIKAWVVGQDEKESGLRAILNFGHTFGHAIEAGMGYGVWLHGEGVAAGMVMAAELSRRLGLIDAEFVCRLTSLIQLAGLPTKGPVLDANDNASRYLELMQIDKKAEAGEIRFVLINGPGKAVVRTAPDSLVREVIDACCE
ncbi:3-dehydroquinate synthase [Acidovorax sp. K2F]|uniref:3-dehydroquinate synthase n=1 Tax=Acidovorax sp. K2F TaxID=2978125 RepID=UPI0021B1311C|nr:3-dehydroquinate synthase [Acidovorax sp. K2F]MCT6717735.1 3-dehydroquinate synthase [Acidovorax sp. K2F]